MTVPEKFIKPGESIGLRLTAAERALLADELPKLDETLIRRIKDVPADHPKVPFTLDELAVLAGQIASELKQSNSRPRQKSLNAINRKVQRLLETYSDDQAAAWAHGKAMMADAGIDLGMLDPVKLLAAEMASTGVSPEAALKSIRPRTVAPEEMVAVHITPAEKMMLLSLPALSEAIRTRISQTPRSA